MVLLELLGQSNAGKHSGPIMLIDVFVDGVESSTCQAKDDPRNWFEMFEDVEEYLCWCVGDVKVGRLIWYALQVCSFVRILNMALKSNIEQFDRQSRTHSRLSWAVAEP